MSILSKIKHSQPLVKALKIDFFIQQLLTIGRRTELYSDSLLMENEEAVKGMTGAQYSQGSKTLQKARGQGRGQSMRTPCVCCLAFIKVRPLPSLRGWRQRPILRLQQKLNFLTVSGFLRKAGEGAWSHSWDAA